MDKKINKKNKYLLYFSYLFVLACFVFAIRSFLYTQYATKIPYVKRYANYLQIKRYAQTLPIGSTDRNRFEAIAEAVRKGQREYTYDAPEAVNNIFSQQ